MDTCYGRLVILYETKRRAKNGTKYYMCKCLCGTMKEIDGAAIRRGHTLSCGCYGKEVRAQALRLKLSRPYRNTPTYTSWDSMIQRCTNKNNPMYPYYGARGISIDNDWIASFDYFLTDMGERPSIDHCIDRINPDAHYCQENCRWILKSENVCRQAQPKDKTNGQFITRERKSS